MAPSASAARSSKPRPARMRRASSRDTSIPSSSAGRCQRSRTSGARTGRGWTSTTPGRTVPPASSAMSAAQRSSAGITIPGSAPRSKRYDASVLRPWRREVRRMPPGWNQADSRSTRVVPAEISESPPPITPASALPRSRSAMRRSSGSSARSLPSRVTSFSPGRAVRTTISRPATLSRSKAWSGWPSSSSTKLVASTTFEMERTPHASSRCASQSGEGPILTPSTTRAA